MIERLFTRAGLIAQLQQPPLGPHLEDLAISLKQHNYADNTIRDYLRSAARFGVWLTGNGLSLAKADEKTVNLYINSLKEPADAGGLPNLVEILRRNQVLPPVESTLATSTESDQWINRFDQHLERVVGAAPTTRDTYRRIVRRLVKECFGDGPLNWETINAENISQFVAKEAAQRRGFGRKVPAVAVRSALRFLVASGDLRDGLQAAAPSMRTWKHAALPRNITQDQVDQVLAGRRGPSRRVQGV